MTEEQAAALARLVCAVVDYFHVSKMVINRDLTQKDAIDYEKGVQDAFEKVAELGALEGN